MAGTNGQGPKVDISCDAYSSTNHAAQTKASRGECSWREHCSSAPVVSATVTYLDTGRRLSYALCERDHLRLHQYFDVRSPDPIEETKHLLRHLAGCFAESCRLNPSHDLDPERVGDLGFGRRGVVHDEASAFLRTWRMGAVEIDTDGRFTLPKCSQCSTQLHLVGRSGSATALHTEYLIHIGAVSELVLDHGWALDRLAFEQGEWDIVGRRHDRVDLVVEAKARANRPDPDSLESLRDSLYALASDPTAPTPPNHSRKFKELQRHVQAGPVEVLLVAADARWWFRADAGPSGGMDFRPAPG